MPQVTTSDESLKRFAFCVGVKFLSWHPGKFLSLLYELDFEHVDGAGKAHN